MIRKQYSIYLTEKESDRLNHQCAVRDMSRSQIVRKALRNLLGYWEDNDYRIELQRKRDELIGGDEE